MYEMKAAEITEHEKEYPFEFSVIMAVYNVEPFLREAVESLISQDFGFDRIQLILVDDGSTDRSAEICDEYAKEYPDNVMAIHKENGGVASARNEGLKYASGRYLNFMDSDDMLTQRTLSAVYQFFLIHGIEIDVISIPMEFFDATHGQHPLNRKFAKGNRVIDLYHEYSLIQLSMSSTFVKTDTLIGLSFDEKLAYAEDAKLLIKILLKKGTIGAVQDGTYLYRKRQTGELSAIQKSQKVPAWYIPYMQFFQEETINYCIKQYGYISKFVQYTLTYDLQWRILQQSIPNGILSADEETLYRQSLTRVLSCIDDDIILAQKSIWQEHKVYALMQNHNAHFQIVKRHNEMFFRFQNSNCYYISNCQFSIEFITIDDLILKIEGYTVIYPFEYKNFNIYAKVNDSLHKCKTRFRKEPYYSLGDAILQYYGFSFELPLAKATKNYSIIFFIDIDGHLIEKRNVVYKKYSPIGKEYRNSYFFKNRWCIIAKENCIQVSFCMHIEKITYELKFLHELLKRKKIGSKKAIIARLLTHLFRMWEKKKIWLICDKSDRADDNGEAFFRYLNQLKPSNIKPYFLIDRDVSDYKRVCSYGTVVPYMSWRHKMLYLLADCIISSYSHDEINNPFLGNLGEYRDLLQKCNYVFLQHGVTKDDISQGTNRFHKNIKLFVCSSRAEYESILQNPSYGYSSREVTLTGLARYDRLYHDERNEIAIMPTWRRSLFGNYHSKLSRWDLRPGFYESEYYKFYDLLLHNERLLDTAKVLDFVINFIPHPIFFPYIDMFDVPDDIKIWGTEVVYRDIFAQNKLIITDFSSVAFDFAYLHKPVIYAHFDTNHYQEGYFDYERDGFGEVEYSLEDTIDRIIEYMENGCKLKDKYRERIDHFFTFNDQDNCKRIYQKIIELQDKR